MKLNRKKKQLIQKGFSMKRSARLIKLFMISACFIAAQPLCSMNNAFNFIQNQGNAAGQRIRTLFTPSPQTVGLAANGLTGALTAVGIGQLGSRWHDIRNMEEWGFANLIAAAGFSFIPRIVALHNFEAAIDDGDIERVRYWLDTGLVDMHGNGIMYSINKSTPLIEAADLGHADIVQLLLNKGANIAVKDRVGKTIEDYLRIAAGDSAATILRKRQIGQIISDYKAAQIRQRFAVHQDPNDVVAQALDALHKARYEQALIDVENITVDAVFGKSAAPAA
jgi:hypothetical protein